MKKIIIALALITPLAQAESVTKPLIVNASIVASCTVAMENISFGVITPAQTGVQQANGNLTTTCTRGVTYNLTLSKGGGASIPNRSMGGANSSDRLKYNIYINTAYVNYLGDGVSAGTMLSPTSGGGAETTTLYGQLSLNQYVRADNYSDNLTVSITY